MILLFPPCCPPPRQVGTRHYYRKLGYHLEGHYMVKELGPPPSRRRQQQQQQQQRQGGSQAAG